MIDDFAEHIRHNPMTTQQEACALAAQQSVMVLGPVYSDAEIRAAATGLAQGLFGEAFDAADETQQDAWIAMCEAEYRRAIQPAN